MLVLASLLLSFANATDVDGIIGDLTYEGGLDQSATGYVKGKPVSISHGGGNIIVRCIDTEKLSARLPYTVTGSNEGSMKAAGDGIGLKASTDGKGGGVIGTRIPSRSSGVASIDAPLTVNIPAGASAVSVSQSGAGWVQVQGCSGALKVTAGGGGAFASGAFTAVNVSAAGGAVKVVMEGGAVLTGSSSISASGGDARLVLSTAQGGKLSAKGAQVSVQQNLMGGSSSETSASGSFGLDGPSISIAAKGNVEVSAQ